MSTLSTKRARVTRRQQKHAARVIRWQTRDLQEKLAMEKAAAALSASDSEDEFEENEIEEIEELRQHRADSRPHNGNKINKQLRGDRVDPLLDYEAMTPNMGWARERGSASRARAHCRATGQDGVWWPALFAQ